MCLMLPGIVSVGARLALVDAGNMKDPAVIVSVGARLTLVAENTEEPTVGVYDCLAG